MRIGKKEEKAGWERRKTKQTGINELYRRSKNKNRRQKKSNGKSLWDFKIKRNKRNWKQNKEMGRTTIKELWWASEWRDTSIWR